MNVPQKKMQTGSLRKHALKTESWSWEWRYVDPATGLYVSKSFASDESPTESAIQDHLKPFLRRLNAGVVVDPTVGDLLDRYIKDENRVAIKDRKPGDGAESVGEGSYSTACSYLSLCNTIRSNWGTTALDKFRPILFQEWLKKLERKPRTKGHLKAFVNRLSNKAKLYGMLEFHENPIGLVEVRGKRSRKPADLRVNQFFLILGLLPECYRDVVLVAQRTGLRVDQLLALVWSAIDFERLCMKVQEGVVNGRIGPVKTEYSEGELPLDPDFATVLLA